MCISRIEGWKKVNFCCNGFVAHHIQFRNFTMYILSKPKIKKVCFHDYRLKYEQGTGDPYLVCVECGHKKRIWWLWFNKSKKRILSLNKVVFLKKGNVFQAQPVSTGIVTNNLIQIIGGLSTQDSVAVNAQFLIDSEGFIKVK